MESSLPMVGTVKNFIYNNGRPYNLSVSVLVEFHNYKHTCCKDKLVQIIPITRAWKSSDIEYSRTHLSISLAYVIIAYKSKVLTLSHAVVDFGDKKAIVVFMSGSV